MRLFEEIEMAPREKITPKNQAKEFLLKRFFNNMSNYTFLVIGIIKYGSISKPC